MNFFERDGARARGTARWVAGLVWLTACAPTVLPPPRGELAALRVSVAPAPRPFLPVALQVQAVDAEGSEVRSVGGDVALTVDQGSLDTGTLSLVDGVATAEVVFSAPVAPLTLTATFGDVSQTVTVDLQPIVPLPGDAATLVASALPSLPYLARDQDYSTDAPDLPGLRLSFNTATVVLGKDTTIGAVNALLERHEAGVVGFAPGAPGLTGPNVALRLPTTTPAAMREAMARLDAEPVVVVAYREMDDGRRLVTTQSEFESWGWEQEDALQPPVDANWGFEAASVPQAWNLSAAAHVASGTDGADRRTVGVVEYGWTPHLDVDYQSLTPGKFIGSVSKTEAERVEDHDHALHVAGIIGARRNTREDPIGIDGVNPFARLLAQRYETSMHWSLEAVLASAEVPRVVNLSIGCAWYLDGVNPNESSDAQQQLRKQARAIVNLLESHEGLGKRVPLIVAAAGNDSDRASLGQAVVEARWGSAVTTAALELGTPGILVVEAVGRAAGGQHERAPFSNRGGHVSAPGVQVFSAVSNPDIPGEPSWKFKSLDGTSMAAPFVSGLASFLLSVEPRLTNAELVQVITGSARPAIGSAPMVNAFGAALAIDVAQANQRVLRSLLDVDDGTEDGNTRVDPVLGDVVLDDSGSGFGPRGDGRVDMRDFRRFRDALLLVEDGARTALNGPQDHPKRDLNLDGRRLDTAAQENVFPRYDFNGDGRISRTAVANVGGAINDSLTDLQVLMHLFADADVDVAELPDLLDSTDVHLFGADAIGVGRIEVVELTFTNATGGTVRVIELDGQRPAAVVTVPAQTLDVTMRYRGAGGEVLAERSVDLADLAPGADVTLRVPNPRPNVIAVSPGTASIAAGQSQQYSASLDGQPRDQEVTWTATGGAISASGLLVAGPTAGTYTVTATSKVDPTVKGSATFTVVVLTLAGTYTGTRVEWDYGDCNGCVPTPARITIVDDPTLGLTLEYCNVGSATTGWCTSYAGGWNIRYLLTVNGTNLTGVGTRSNGTYAGLLQLTAAVAGNRITGSAYWQPDCPGGCYDAFDVSR